MSNLDFHPRAKLTDSIDISTLESMRNSGMSNVEIAKSLGVSPSAVGKYLPPIFKQIDDETRQGIIRAYHQKKTVDEVAVMFSVSNTSVHRIWRKAGLTKDSKFGKRMTNKNKQDILRYRELGWSVSKIAETIGFSVFSIYDFLNKHRLAEAPVRLDGTPDIRTVREEEKSEEKHETLSEQLQNLVKNGQAEKLPDGTLVPTDIPLVEPETTKRSLLEIEKRVSTVRSHEYKYTIDDVHICADRFDKLPSGMDMQIVIPKKCLRGLIAELTELADMIERGDV